MFRALWIKHWVQLRAFRWAGFGIGLALPFFLWGGAAAARRGWLPFSLESFSLDTLFGEAQPVFAAAIWGLLAILFAGQAHAGDRSEGTDRFLAERPVKPRSIWLARWCATTTSILVVIVSTSLYNLALVALVQDGTRVGVYLIVFKSIAAGAVFALLGSLAGMAAGELVRTPMQAFGIGLVLTSLAVGIPLTLASFFLHVRLWDFHLAMLLAPILPLAFVLASYRSGCLGEPAGRGRIARGAWIIGTVLLLTPLLFVATTPFTLRLAASDGWPASASREGHRVALLGGDYRSYGGWLVDVAARKKIRFLAPPIELIEWAPDGSMLAVVHRSGILGSVGSLRLEILDADGEPLFLHDLDDDSNIDDLRWAGRRLLVTDQMSWTETRIRVFDPQAGLLGEIPVPGSFVGGGLLGPTDHGTIYVHHLIGRDPSIYVIEPVEIESLSLGAPILTEDDDLPTYSPRTLSPSGGYWTRSHIGAESRDSWLIELATLRRTEYPGSYVSGWLDEDRLVRVESRDGESAVVIQTADGEILETKTFAARIGVVVSPDRQQLLVKEFKPMDPNEDENTRRYILDKLWVRDGETWTDLGSLVDESDGRSRYLGWAEPGILMNYGERGTVVAEAVPGARWVSITGGN